MLTTDRPSDLFVARNTIASGTPASPRGAGAYGPQETLELLWRYRRFLAVVVLAGPLLSLAIGLLLTPIYTASSALVFDRNDNRPYEASADARQLERNKSAMETELDVIRSRVFLGTVVDSLELVNDPFYNTYLSSAESRFDGLFRTLGLKGKDSRAGQEARNVSPQAQRDRAISRLLETFTVDRKGDSLAMTVHVKQTNPTRAAALADAIAERYVSWTSKLKDSATRQTVEFLDQQASDLVRSIAEKEREIASFASVSDLSFDPKDDLLRARMEQLNEQYTLARVDEAGAWARVNEAKRRRSVSGDAGVGEVVTSDHLTGLRTEGARLERLLAQLSSKFGKSHPEVMDAQAELTSNRAMAADEANRIIRGLENEAEIASLRVNKFAAEVGVLQERIKSRNLSEIKRRELERDLTSEQKRYDAVVQRLGELNPEVLEVKNSAVVASYAEVPTEPSFPQLGFLIAGGTVGFIFLGVVAVIIADLFDSRLYQPDMVEGVLRRPNLTTIPDYRIGARMAIDPYSLMLKDPNTAIARATRSLCLAWRSLDRQSGGKILMVASANSGDGKTTCALAMAAMATTTGVRTVIVDSDPRSNGAAARLQVLSSDTEWRTTPPRTGDRVPVSPLYPYLNVIVSRPSAHDCEQLFASLRDSFDLVIVDAPALSESQEAVWLSTYTDSVVVVVSSGVTRERDLAYLAERLNLSDALLLGGILNFHGRPRDGIGGAGWSARLAGLIGRGRTRQPEFVH
ncbi:exopolysaccharide transport family protein [Rhizobium sp. TRM95111]|uniref:GumC family protein n=1 Tax=Rhizobium alarense TaxID=2846851 RepID=UPI001F2F46EA|nr:exopolysaccharide transport family protein [Rhizobium alarense]MCF3641820.1 exopolysaccharide transport family protein [Rhizobium alarense]